MATGERFDAVTRLFGGSLSRRQAFKLAVGSALGTVGLVALRQQAADAACTPENCAAPNVCCPNTVFGAGTCAPPLFPQCCGTSSCAAAPEQQCCPGSFAGTQFSPPFCAPGPPVVCCGAIACAPGARCVGTASETCCLASQAPEGSTCCGPLPLGCPPGTVCSTYPLGTFSCVPV